MPTPPRRKFITAIYWYWIFFASCASDVCILVSQCALCEDLVFYISRCKRHCIILPFFSLSLYVCMCGRAGLGEEDVILWIFLDAQMWWRRVKWELDRYSGPLCRRVSISRNLFPCQFYVKYISFLPDYDII